METMWIMGFHEPDGFYVEVIWRKPDAPDTESSSPRPSASVPAPILRA
jgi:hypothetical protein